MVTRYVIYGENTNRISEIHVYDMLHNATLENEAGLFRSNKQTIDNLLEEDTVHILEQEYICQSIGQNTPIQ